MKRMNIEVWHSVELPTGETELLFSFEYTPAERGGRDNYGQATEPDSPACMEFQSALGEKDISYEVDEADIEAAREKAFDEVEETNDYE